MPKLMTTLKNRTSSNPVNRHNLPVKGATCQSQVWIDIAAQDLRKYPQLGNCTIALPYIGLPLNPLDDHHFPYPHILKTYVLHRVTKLRVGCHNPNTHAEVSKPMFSREKKHLKIARAKVLLVQDFLYRSLQMWRGSCRRFILCCPLITQIY